MDFINDEDIDNDIDPMDSDLEPQVFGRSKPSVHYAGVLLVCLILSIVLLFVGYFAWKKYRRQMNRESRMSISDKTPLMKNLHDDVQKL